MCSELLRKLDFTKINLKLERNLRYNSTLERKIVNVGPPALNLDKLQKFHHIALNHLDI